MKTPSIGRIVHYQDGDQARAAIVTRVSDEQTGQVGLCVFTHLQTEFLLGVYYSEAPASGCWSWPPFVPGGA